MSLDRNKSSMVVGLTALAALLLALQPKQPSHADKTGKSGEKASLLDALGSDGPAPDGPLKPVWDFLGAAPKQANKPDAVKQTTIRFDPAGKVILTEETRKPDEPDLYQWPSGRELESCSFRFLIVTLPDPVESHFPYVFDQTLEAVQRALESEGYVIDRFWLPWKTPAAKGTDLRLHERHPGTLLFRGPAAANVDEPKRNLLLVLLVGETPTAGLRPAVFRRAVEVISGCSKGSKKEGNAIRVVGPHFSGSADSLNRALRETRKVHDPSFIRVVSGSANGFEPDKFVKGWSDNQPQSTFTSTVLPNALLRKWLRRYMWNPTNPASDSYASNSPILLLHEGNTWFGTYESKRQGNSRGTHECQGETQEEKEYRVAFPLHISQLRSSYTKEQLERMQQQGLPRVGRNLPIPTEEGADRSRESLPAYSPLLIATQNDLVMQSLLTSMVQYGQVRHVELLATDPQDVIFLARLIHDRDPDIQLITAGSDMLFVHEDYAPAMRGTLVASTYPLFPPFQRWSAPRDSRARLLFASDAAQGYYNATLVHLADAPEKTAHNPDGTAVEVLRRMTDYGWDASSATATTVPPIWISIVGGNGQFIPVGCIEPATYRDKYNEATDGTAIKYVFARQLHRAESATGTEVLSPNSLGALVSFRSDTTPSVPGPTAYAPQFPHLWYLLFLIFLIVNVYVFRQIRDCLRESTWDTKAPGRCSQYKQRMDFAVVVLAQVLLFGRFAILGWTPLRFGLLKAHGLLGLLTVLYMVASLAVMVYALWTLIAHWWSNGGGKGYEDVVKEDWPISGLHWLSAGSGRVARLGHGGLWIVVGDVAMFLVVVLTFLCLLGRWAVDAFRDVGVQDLIYFERVVHITNGTSPLLPRLFLCMSLFGWGGFLVRKLYLASHFQVECPIPPKSTYHHFQTFDRTDAGVRAELMPPSTFRRHFGWCFGLLLFLLAGFLKLVYEAWPAPAVDGLWFGLLSLAGFVIGSYLLIFTLLQFIFAWRCVKDLLAAFALLPMAGTFDRLSDKVVAIFGNYLFSIRPRDSNLSIPLQYFLRLRRLFPAFRNALQSPRPTLDDAVRLQAQAALPTVFPNGVEPDLEATFGSEGNDVAKRAACRELARRCLAMLQHVWPAQSLDEAFGRAAASAGQPAAAAAPAPAPTLDPIWEWVAAAEDFVAVEIIRYLSQFIMQIRNLLYSLTVGTLLLLIAATVYPIFPQRQLLLFLTLLSLLTYV